MRLDGKRLDVILMLFLSYALTIPYAHLAVPEVSRARPGYSA